MNGRLLALTLALVLCAPSAWAGGVNLAWTECYSDGGTTGITNSCSGDTGPSLHAIGSFVLTAPEPDFVGLGAVIDLEVDDTALPDWWQLFNPGSCRPGALSAAFTFPGLSQTSCLDPWSGQAAGGIAAYQTSTTIPANPSPDPSRARIRLVAGIPAPISLATGQEYLGFDVAISQDGTTTCAGCTTPATLVLTLVEIMHSDNSAAYLTDPVANNCITYQTSSVPCGALPAVSRSWGQLKSLYR